MGRLGIDLFGNTLDYGTMCCRAPGHRRAHAAGAVAVPVAVAKQLVAVVGHVLEQHLGPPGAGYNPEIAFEAGISLGAVQFRQKPESGQQHGCRLGLDWVQ